MSQHPMVALFQEDPAKIIALLLWSSRRQLNGLSATITAKDMQDFALAIEAFGGQPSVALKGAEESITVSLVDEATRRQFEADPTLNENSPEAQRMARNLAARKRAPQFVKYVTAPGHIWSPADMLESVRIIEDLS
jgi:hypothetical protein